MTKPSLPSGPNAIEKGKSLSGVLSDEAIRTMARNIAIGHKEFPQKAFIQTAKLGLDDLKIMDRGHHLAHALRKHLPEKYEDAIDVLLRSLTPPMTGTDSFGLAVFFYLPHTCYVWNYGLDKKFNGGKDPFPTSMRAQYELTRRFSAEFSIRPFLVQHQERTIKQLLVWTKDKDPHVRRLCSEGTRPKLPWGMHIQAFVKDPSPALPILEALKDDEDLYVRRSVANHLGDIAKNHLPLVLELCERWLKNASDERKWLIRHALRYPAKKGVDAALKLRKRAK